jgi:hypothetical protein
LINKIALRKIKLQRREISWYLGITTDLSSKLIPISRFEKKY